jgi:hypothetical protein
MKVLIILIVSLTSQIAWGAYECFRNQSGSNLCLEQSIDRSFRTCALNNFFHPKYGDYFRFKSWEIRPGRRPNWYEYRLTTDGSCAAGGNGGFLWEPGRICLERPDCSFTGG